MENEIINQEPIDIEEKNFENSLRPQTLEEFIGQDKLKANLKVFIDAAKKRGQALDHCLFYAPPGLGKTTLANIISREMGSNLRSTSGPVLERVGDLAAILTNLCEGDIFFIDEIHRMNHLVEEALYPAMEDFELDIIIGQGPSAKTIKLPVPRFTLVGATTRAGLLSSPLRDRFGIVSHLEFYSDTELATIIKRSASILKVEIQGGGITEIAKRSRGTPRIANRLLKRVRDFAEVKNNGLITQELAATSLECLEVDSAGLDLMDRRILKAIIEKFSGGPVGVDTIAVSVSEEVDTVTDVYEPYLIKAGFLARTPRGRVVTSNAYKHLGLNPPQNSQEKLL
ncbi:MAG: Holliday junction branch migration DNA helicase RuvB [Endomicrobiales bacterium]|nr:Holliday junction branch migration DNA helicase RuvB [Endomicrobiales bacterium]